MKKIKNLLISFLVAACAVCLSLAFVACSGGDKSGSKYGYGEEGVYYYSADSETDYLMTLQSGTYMISLKGVSSYSGTYTYDAEAGTVSFKSSDGETFEASFADDAMQLAISGQPYTFLRSVNETVTFMDGNSVVDTRTVTYGKAAETIDGEKSGYIFLGWYEDQSFTTKYTFDTAVTGNLTLYAYYIEIDSTIANFDVNFVMDGETIYSTKTQNGVVYDIPEVGGILGWWVSDTNDGSELTYRYDGQLLNEATNLYAVKANALGASVYGDKVTWEGSASSVTITVDGTVVTSSAANGAYAYDFDSLSTGSHEIEVSASGYGTENLVYVVNRLARVSNFSVYGTTLVYNAVENAQYYYISVTCANPSHDHTMVYNGNTLTYDFSNCEMGPEGITFTVYAYGKGYTESVSETFVYALILDGTTVTIDKTTDTATWTVVSGATGYEVYVNGEYVATTTGTEYSLKYYDINEDIAISVKPVAPGYYSEASEAASYQKVTLPAPEITGINEYTVSWTDIPGATNYIIYVNGKQIETVSYGTTEYALATDEDFVKADSYVITIKATSSSNTNQNSQESDSVYATDDTMSPLLVYEGGVVYWQYAMAVGTYYVSINDGDETPVEGKNWFDVTFTQSGENVIKVYFKTDGGNSAVASLSVTTYAVIFDTRGGNSIDTIYVARGDTLTLTTPEYLDGEADFAGWYTLPDLVGNFDSTSYMGEGCLYESGSVFDGNSTLILYAAWLSVKYNVYLDPGIGTLTDDDGNAFDSALIAKNSSSFTIAVPVSEDVTYVFFGWYSGTNGTGKRYTDENGNAVRAFDQTSDITLYAYWRKVVDFTKDTYHGQEVLSAYAGEAIDLVSEITIPETYVYGGTEYRVALLGSTAFNSCSNLVTINIPDTIEYITLSSNGYTSGSGAFARSANIQNVNIYETSDEPDPTKEFIYYSADGVLFKYDSTYGYVELTYYPQGRTESTYTIPSTVSNSTECDAFYAPITHAVESIGSRVFYDKTFTELIVPASVTNVESYAFYYTKITRITFSGDDGDPLTLGAYAFQGCSTTDITLPSRLASININSFDMCYSLKNVYVSGNGGNFGDIDGVLCNSDLSTIYYYPQGRSSAVYTIPTSVQTVGESAFKNTSISGLIVPANVTRICDSAFKYCSVMATLEFQGDEESGNLYIESQAFYGCTALKSVVLPPNLVGLAEYSFGGCTNLKEVTYDARSTDTVESLSGLMPYAFSSYGSTVADSYVEILNLGKNVPAIQFASIFGNENLATVNIAEDSPYFSSESGVVFNKEMTAILYFPSGWVGSYTIPETISVVGNDTFTGSKKLTEVIFPATVTEIGQNAFMDCTALQKVTFEAAGISGDEKELTIGDQAFYGCSSLVEFVIPARLVSLGTDVFAGCSSLEEIIVEEGNIYYTAKDGVLYGLGDDHATPTVLIMCPINNRYSSIVIYASITSIESTAFNDNVGVKEISFSGTVDPETFTLEKSIFAGCTGLEKITLPDGLLTIETNLFYQCNSLKEVVIPESVTKICKAAFHSCTNLTTVTFLGTRTEANKLTIESGTNATATANAGAFYWCRSLKSIDLPDYTVMGDYTFYNCYALEEFNIPVGTTEIPNYIFSGCNNLTTVNIDESCEITSVGTNAFSGCNKLEGIDLGDKVTSFGASAFSSCSSLTSFVIPEGVTSLVDSVFAKTGLTTINLPASLQSITYKTFDSCASLTKITVTEGSQYFMAGDDGVLYGLSNGLPSSLWIYPKANPVTSITVPASVTTIQTSALSESSLTEIIFESKIVGDTVYSFNPTSVLFSTCRSLEKVVLPEGMTTISAFAFENGYYKTIVIPSTVTTISNEAFSGCSRLEEVIFTEGGTEPLAIPDGSYYDSGYYVSVTTPFNDCISLKELNFPERLTSLGAYMCYGCTSLEKVTIAGSNITSIPTYAFYGCSSLSTIQIADTITITSVGDYAFYGCGSLNLNLSSATSIGAHAFDGSGLQSVVLGEGLTAVLEGTFYQCAKLTAISIPASVTSIGDYAFAYCSALGTVTFATGRNDDLTIGNSAFIYCKSLTSVEIPATVTSIGEQAFSHTNSLKIVTFDDGSKLSEVGSRAFEYSGIASFAFPESSATITLGDLLFVGSYYLSDLYISSSVQSLGDALNDCITITKITVSSSANASYSVDETQPVLYNKDRTQIVRIFGQMTGTYEIPNGITEISAYAFQNQSLLTGVVIPSGVTIIGNYAFDGCSSLSSVTFDSGASATLGSHVFQNCTSLKNIDCTAVETFGAYAFSGCTALENVTLSSQLAALNDYMFYGCKSLKGIDLPSNVAYLGVHTFENSGLESIVIPEGVVNFGDAVGSVPSVTTDVYTFANCTSLKQVVLSSKLASIGGHAFYGCTSLEKISYTGSSSSAGNTSFPSSLALIGQYAFYGTGLIQLTVPAVASIGDYAFANCASLKSVGFADGVTVPSAYMFSGCTSLEDIDFTNVSALTSNYVFVGCTSLVSVDLSPVSAITGQYIFKDCSSLYSVIWSSAVYTVPAYMFQNCLMLASLTGFETVTEVATYAFSGCSSLYDLTAFASLETTGAYAYDGCAFDGVNLTDVSSLGNYTFRNCTSLRSIIFPTNITTIPEGLFYGCTSLESVSIPSTVTEIKQSAFQNCTSIELMDVSGVGTLGQSVFEGCTSLTGVELGTSITTIPQQAFTDCVSIVSFEIPDNIKTINAHAFEGCTALESIAIPSVGTMQTYCFNGCVSLVEATFTGCTFTTLPNYTFYECTSLEKVEFINITEMTTFGTYAFYGCTALEEIELPTTVKTLNTYVFAYCTSLKHIDLTYVTSISGGYNFYGSGLESVYFPKDLTSSYGNMFAFCSDLMYFEVDSDSTHFRAGESGELINISSNYVQCWPGGYEGIAYIEDGLTITSYSFMGCDKVTGVVLSESVTSVPLDAFMYCTSLEYVSIPSTVDTISQSAFAYTAIKSVTIPDSVTSLGSGAFACTPLETVVIEGAPSSIGQYVFAYCPELTSVTLAEGFDTIGKYMFYEDTSLKTIEIPDSVSTIETYAFAYSGLERIEIPANVKTIGDYAFYNCAIEELDFKATSVTMGDYVFAGCESLTKAVFTDGLTEIGTYTFAGCGSLTDVTLPETLVEIGDYVFCGCASLTSITLPDSVETLGNSCFEGCVKLETVELDENLESVGDSAFAGCTSVEEIYIPFSVATLGENVFSGWTTEQTINVSISEFFANAWWTSGWDTGCEATVVYDFEG